MRSVSLCFSCAEMDSNRPTAITTPLCVLDNLLSLVLVSTLVVSYWRGCWQVMDIFLFPGNPKLSVFSSLIIGVVPGMIFCLLQQQLENAFDVNKRPFLHIVGSRLYTVIFAITCVNHWRGVWQLWDVYTGTSWLSGAVSTVLGLTVLIITRGLRNILAPPFYISPDKPDKYFHVPTLFGAQKSSMGTRLLDAFFTVVVTGSVVVFVWRGAWVVLDRVLFPSHPAASAIGSMGLGLIGSLLAFLCQGSLACYLRSIGKGWRKIIIEDVYNIVCFAATVNVWRGVWAGLNVFFLTDHPVASNLVTAVVGQALLTALYCANSLLVRGGRMDGSDPGADGITFDTSYIRSFRKKRSKMRAKVHNYWSKETETGEEPSLTTSDQFNKLNGGACGVGSQESDGRLTLQRDGRNQQRFGDSLSKAEKATNCLRDAPERIPTKIVDGSAAACSGGSKVSKEHDFSTSAGGNETSMDGFKISSKEEIDEKATRFDGSGQTKENFVGDVTCNDAEAVEISNINEVDDREPIPLSISECAEANPSDQCRENEPQTYISHAETPL